jgi:hypothetical protein
MNDQFKPLYARLKPEAKRNLLKNKVKYSYSVTKMIAILKAVQFVADLKVDELERLYRWTDTGRFEKNFSFYELTTAKRIFKQ